MIKKLLLLLCILSQVTMPAEINNDKIKNVLDKLSNKVNRKRIQKIKNINTFVLLYAIDKAEDHFCEMVGGNKALIPVPFKKRREKDELTLLETQDIVAVAITVMGTIAQSKEKELEPLLNTCGREALKAYIGNKLYHICSSYSEPLCAPRLKQLATTIENELPADVIDAVHEAHEGPIIYDALKTVGAFILKGSISLILDTIDNSIYSNNTGRKL